MKSTKVMIIDDHEVVRRGLRSLLDTDPSLEVVGEANDGFEAIKQVSAIRPDVVIVDLQLPGINGLEVIRQITKTVPKTKVIVFTFYGNEANILSALHAGAKGYVVKDSSVDELIRGIKEVVAGRRYLGSPLPELAIDVYMNIGKEDARDPYEMLTSREREVLQLVAEGCTNTQIADRLFISRRTVEIHRSNMMRKLGLHRPQVDLVQYAMQRGLIKPLCQQDKTIDETEEELSAGSHPTQLLQ